MVENQSYRRERIAKIKVASKTLALEEDSYRALLNRVTGKSSCADMTMRELDAVLEEFKGLGFKAKKKQSGNRKQANSAQAAKIRALWLCLYHMGAINEPSEHALAQFSKRSCGVEDLHWIDTRHADLIIRALRGWMERLGYRNPGSDVIETVAKIRKGHFINAHHDADVVAVKLHLIEYQIKKLGITRIAVREGDFEITDLVRCPSETLDKVIEELGVSIRK